MSFTNEEILEFTTEAQELLDSAEKSLLALDKGGKFALHYDSIFRTFHSIKGAAGMMDMPILQGHVHQLENLLTEQKSKEVLDKPYIELFLKGTDAARRILAGEKISFNYTVSASPPKKAVVAGAATPVSAPRATAKAPEEGRIGKVIVVDDEPELVEVISQTLSDAGLTPIGTSKPEEVIDLVEKQHPDVILTDVAMPKMNGLQLLNEMKQKYPDVPVIFVSGHVTKETLLEAISHGVYGVIEKPFESKRVIESCLNAARRHQLTKLLNRSINLIMYQFSDLDTFLKSQGKEDVRKAIDQELQALLEQRRQIRANKKQAA